MCGVYNAEEEDWEPFDYKDPDTGELRNPGGMVEYVSLLLLLLACRWPCLPCDRREVLTLVL